jgi:hypothetical protein
VGVSVMNSRSAKNDTSPNNTITPMRPNRNAMPMRTTIAHQALMRAFRLAMPG